jgi:hypothetical protein
MSASTWKINQVLGIQLVDLLIFDPSITKVARRFPRVTCSSIAEIPAALQKPDDSRNHPSTEALTPVRFTDKKTP